MDGIKRAVSASQAYYIDIGVGKRGEEGSDKCLSWGASPPIPSLKDIGVIHDFTSCSSRYIEKLVSLIVKVLLRME